MFGIIMNLFADILYAIVQMIDAVNGQNLKK